MLLRLSAILLLCGIAACAPATNSTVERQALGIQGTVFRGTIIAMRPVAVSGTRSGIGPAAGAVGGGFLGSTVGGDWRARTVGGVVGALAGGVVGGAIEEAPPGERRWNSSSGAIRVANASLPKPMSLACKWVNA
jgi:outer membrane lipoprotein SlyB